MADSPTPAAPPPALDRDLYCLSCGYNLHGLSGDPVRCPECGNLNPIGDVEIPAEFITAQLRKMERDLSVSIIAFIFAVPLQVGFWTTITRAIARPDAWAGCLAVLAFGLLAYWVSGCVRFRETCRAQPGWVGALIAYHAWSLVQLVALVATMIAGGTYLDFYSKRLVSTRAHVAWIASLAATTVLLVFLIRWSNRRARAPLARLQRAFAVSAIREKMHAQTGRRRRSLFG